MCLFVLLYTILSDKYPTNIYIQLYKYKVQVKVNFFHSRYMYVQYIMDIHRAEKRIVYFLLNSIFFRKKEK